MGELGHNEMPLAEEGVERERQREMGWLLRGKQESKRESFIPG